MSARAAMTYGPTGVSVRRNLPYLTPIERRMLDTSELERKARQFNNDMARRLGVRPPGAR